MRFFFKPMTEVDARHIATWHYPPPYDFYDMDSDPEDLAELLDPQSWRMPHYAAFDEENMLAGFFEFTPGEQATEIGLGLRPDLTGKGLGQAFIEAGLAFGRKHHAAQMWSLRVAMFNQRAIRLYERAGFKQVEMFMQRTNGGEYEFLRMIRVAE